jgi:hypothetical protein
LHLDATYFIILLCLTPNNFTRQGESAATQRVKSHKSLHYLVSKKIYHYLALQYLLDQPQDARLALEIPPFDLKLGRKSKEKLKYKCLAFYMGHVLKGETSKRNDRNETAETTETTETKRPKQNDRNDRNETAETKRPKIINYRKNGKY